METAADLLFDSAFLSKLEQLYLLSKKLFRGHQHAERRSKQTGSSLEFADYRNYALGDDLRSIDWNIYGRLDRLFVKLFEEEQDLPVYFLIDASASMQWMPAFAESRKSKVKSKNVQHANTPSTFDLRPSTKFDQARRIAASLAYIALANLDRVNMHYFSSELGGHMGMSRGKAQFHKVLEFLQRMPPQNGATRLLPCFRAFAQQVKRRGLVFVLSDFFDPAGCEEPLALLRYNQFETHLIHILDPAEVRPELLGDLRLLDAETNQPFEVIADQSLLNRYRREIAAFIAQLQNFCMKRQIGYAQASTAIPFEDLVLRVLRDGRLVK